jgi:hypothetical protein
VQAAQQWVDGKTQRATVVIIERDLQPFESLVGLTPHGVNLSDLIGESIASMGDKIG